MLQAVQRSIEKFQLSSNSIIIPLQNEIRMNRWSKPWFCMQPYLCMEAEKKRDTVSDIILHQYLRQACILQLFQISGRSVTPAETHLYPAIPFTRRYWGRPLDDLPQIFWPWLNGKVNSWNHDDEVVSSKKSIMRVPSSVHFISIYLSALFYISLSRLSQQINTK